jgi:hypothetical protein
MGEKFPGAKKFRDYRIMLDSMKEIDAVTVSTPDHMHAPCAMYAMALGKHVYVQKPLTHTVGEARMMREAAHKYKVQTQMGNQGHSGDDVRAFCEMIWAGAIGQVTDVYTWTDRPIWPQGIAEPYPEEPVPPTMDWPLWLGVAPARPYNKKYAPFHWRGWWKFGCGALGDMACHIMDPANWALKLYETPPTSVELIEQVGMTSQCAPNLSTLKYVFPAKQGKINMYWYDGSWDMARKGETQNFPPKPDVLKDVKLDTNGSIFIGTKGVITIGTYGGSPKLYPEALAKDYKAPAPTLPRVKKFGDPGKTDEDLNHCQNWIAAIKGGPAPCSNFDYSGPFTEFVVLGNLAVRTGGKIEWDSKNMRVTNNPAANQYVHKTYPKGWGIS